MPVSTQTQFDAFAWIQSQFPNHLALDFDHLRPVLCFALIWNRFETVACRTHANATTIRRAVDHAHQKQPLDHYRYQRYVDFFRSRYLRDGDLDRMFQRLLLRDPESRVVVGRVLRGDTQDTDNVVYALLLVGHRIRNNLFHGNKQIPSLPSQTELFEAVNQLLSEFVDDFQSRMAIPDEEPLFED